MFKGVKKLIYNFLDWSNIDNHYNGRSFQQTEF